MCIKKHTFVNGAPAGFITILFTLMPLPANPAGAEATAEGCSPEFVGARVELVFDILLSS